jgi:preprotein translocase subunit SecD
MSLLRKLVLALALGALLSVAVVFGLRYYVLNYWQGWRPDLAKDGGTVLIYEVDTEQSPPDYDLDKLAASLHQRLDRFDTKGISVCPAPDHRVEVRVPRQRHRDHESEVDQVKELLAENGKLEFRILANSEDDQQVFDSVLNNPEESERLKAAAAGDKNPPAPRPIAGQGFDTDLGSFTYSWVELGREQRAFYQLNGGAADEPGGSGDGTAGAREDGNSFTYGAGLGPYRTNLFFRRTVRNPDRLPEKDRGKKYEYFILTRDPARDEDGRPLAVTGELIKNAYPTYDLQEREAIGFELNPEGAARLKELTAANKDRQLAIILDGVIRSAPNVRGPIEATGIITGDFTRQEVDRLANILRAGSLPAMLKPMPVSETTVEPRK